MRNVRVFFKKYGRVRFTSHLDMNRYMIHAIRRSHLPVWYTEGFNPHPYITFALPLSLGFESDYEVMDFRLTDDSVTDEEVVSALSHVLPEGLEVFRAAEQIKKPGKITAASFEIFFENTDSHFANDLAELLKRESITVEKKGKKGKISIVELGGRFKELSIEKVQDGAVMRITLPAGGSDNINPQLYLSAAEKNDIPMPAYKIRRTALLCEDNELFA